MNKISFSHPYKKLEVVGVGIGVGTITKAILLGVSCVDLENLEQPFLDYDTDKGKYKLPKKGVYLLLLFSKTDRDLFTTLRRYTLKKFIYYHSRIGETFSVEVKED
ncbi:MAG: hypothetical protein KKB31_01340 [Nanoarchaeota archaeon]|nr:hypothetical protein [Nanoarchaeota archaeon]